MDSTWECVIVGGGAAGLSAALVLGRARRRTLLVDAGRPSNAPAEGIGGLLGQDGSPPHHLYAAARAEIGRYGTVEIVAGEVVAGAPVDGLFELALADGSRRSATTVLVAAGMDYRFPDLPGLSERWGRSVFHCRSAMAGRCETGVSVSSAAASRVSTARGCSRRGAATSRSSLAAPINSA